MADTGESGGRVRVLVVEDEADSRELYADALRNAGFDVVAAGSFEEAQQAIARHDFAAAVLDVFLPDGRGLALIDMLRERDSQVVAIVITGFASLDTALEALRRGAYEYLCKPFTMDELVRALRRGLERRELVLANLRLVERLSALAEQLAAQRAVLSEQVQAERSRIEAINEIVEQISRGSSAEAALVSLCEAALRLAGADMAAVVASEGGRLVAKAVAGQAAPIAPGEPLADSRLVSRALSGQPALSGDLLLDGELSDELWAGYGFMSGAALPIPGRPAVLLCLSRSPGAFTEEKVSLLGLVADKLAEHLAEEETAEQGDDFVDIDRLL